MEKSREGGLYIFFKVRDRITKLLKALAKALQYALPFDLKGALARRAMRIPDRFKADELKVHHNSLPSFVIQTIHSHHRLSTQ